MPFPLLEIVEPQIISELTVEQKKLIVDDFCDSKGVCHIKHFRKFTTDQVTSLYGKLWKFHAKVLEKMNVDPDMTEAELQDAMYVEFPGQQQGIVDYILIKIVKASTTQKTYAAFKALFPREV